MLEYEDVDPVEIERVRDAAPGDGLSRRLLRPRSLRSSARSLSLSFCFDFNISSAVPFFLSMTASEGGVDSVRAGRSEGFSSC